MTDKVQKIREEIAKKLEVMQYQVHRKDAYKELKGVLSYIDSLQEEPVSEELVDAAKKYGTKKHPMTTTGANDSAYDFKAGARWQKEKDEEEKVLIYKHGFNDCKEQMMTEVIDAEICEVPDNNYSLYEHTHLELFVEPDTLEKNGFKDNNKVKVIVIKKD